MPTITIELQEDHYRLDQPNRRFCMIEPDSLLGDNLTRLQIQERRVETGWNLVFTTQTDEDFQLGLIDVWMKSDPAPPAQAGPE